MGMEQAGACLDWLYLGKTFISKCRKAAGWIERCIALKTKQKKKATKKPQTETKQKNKVNKIEAREWEGNLVRSKASSLELNCSILLQNWWFQFYFRLKLTVYCSIPTVILVGPSWQLMLMEMEMLIWLWALHMHPVVGSREDLWLHFTLISTGVTKVIFVE